MGMPFLGDTKVQLEGRYPEAIFQMSFNLHSAPGCAREKAVLLNKKDQLFYYFFCGQYGVCAKVNYSV